MAAPRATMAALPLPLLNQGKARNMIVKRDRDDRPGSAEEEALLQQTEGIELTKQDVQEGYDVDLLDASPRGIGPSDASALPLSVPPSPTPSSTLPPASPAATTSLAPASSTTSLEPPFSDAVELLPVKSSAAREPPKNSPRKAVVPAPASPRNAAQVYAARARAAEFASDAKRKERVGPQGAQLSDGGVGNYDTADDGPDSRWLNERRRRFKVSHLERRVWIWLAVVVFACIAIGVGVGVGVGLGLKDRGGEDEKSGGEDQQDAPVRPTMMGGDSPPLRVPPEVTVPITPDALPSSMVDDTYATPL